MIKKFVEAFEANRNILERKYSKQHPSSYLGLVTDVVEILSKAKANKGLFENLPDPKRITEIDDGDYQGTLVFVIAAQGYQPSTYWYVAVGYGSCSGCDTLQGIRYDGAYDADVPNEEQVASYLTLALHVVQEIRQMYSQKGKV